MSAARNTSTFLPYRFKRWTRTAWGAFCSLSREVTIGGLSGEVASALTSKTRNKSLPRNTKNQTPCPGESESDIPPKNDIAETLILNLLQPIQVGTFAPKGSASFAGLNIFAYPSAVESQDSLRFFLSVYRTKNE